MSTSPIKKVLSEVERKRIAGALKQNELRRWTRSYARSAPKGNIPVRHAGYHD